MIQFINMKTHRNYFFNIRSLCKLMEVILMGKRVTIMIDDDIDKKLRLIQAKQISKTSSSVSFSNVLNEALRRQLK